MTRRPARRSTPWPARSSTRWPARHRQLVGVGALLVGAAAIGVDVEVGGPLARLDHQVLRAAAHARSPGLTRVVVAVTDAGGWPSRVVVGAVVATWLYRATGRRRPLVVTAAVLALAPATSALLKRAVGRARPPRELAVSTPGDPSFPSGHATATAALAVVLAGLVLQAAGARLGRPGQVVVVAEAVLAAAAVGASRVYLGAHWLSDVLAGDALGAAVGLALLALLGGPAGRGVKPG